MQDLKYISEWQLKELNIAGKKVFIELSVAFLVVTFSNSWFNFFRRNLNYGREYAIRGRKKCRFRRKTQTMPTRLSKASLKPKTRAYRLRKTEKIYEYQSRIICEQCRGQFKAVTLSTFFRASFTTKQSEGVNFKWISAGILF